MPLIVTVYQTLNCFYNSVYSNNMTCHEGVILSLTLQHGLLWCRVLPINYTTDNICDSLRTELRGADTKYLCVQLNSVGSSSMAGHVASLTLVTLQISYYVQTFPFPCLISDCDKLVLEIHFTSFIIFLCFWSKQWR